MGDRPSLSKGEMEVARVLWEKGKGTVREIHEAFPPERQIDFSTVQTYLRRLEAKGYIKGELKGRARLYTPKVRQRTVIRETLDDLIERLFGGETLPLVRHLIEDRGVTAEELEQLKAMIDERDAQKKGNAL